MIPDFIDKNPILQRGNATQNDLETLARHLAKLIAGGDTIALQGDLGAGKSTFTRAFLRELGVTEDIPSPTFTLIQIYDTVKPMAYHADLYRLTDPSEILELGLIDPAPDSVRIVEWPERAGDLLPKDALWICLGFTENPEHRNLSAYGAKEWRNRLRNF